ENRRRGKTDPEFELLDTGIFDDSRYFDVFVEYAKASPDDLLIRITAANRGPEAAPLYFLPTLWFRNTWSWGCSHAGCGPKPFIRSAGDGTLLCQHATLGRFRLAAAPVRVGSGESGVGSSEASGTAPEFLFTDNETNTARFGGGTGAIAYVKDAFHESVVK